MKKIITLFSVLFSLSALAQNVLCSRSAPLENDGYSITGTAHIEKLSNDEKQLRLSADYTTSSGPDVRIYLSKTAVFNTNDVVEVVNLATNSDFSGAKTFTVPSNVVLKDYPYVLFHCLMYSQPWAKGTWSEVSGSCEPTAIWDNQSEQELSFYPNPTTGIINFGQVVHTVNVYSTQGQLLLTSNKTDVLDLSSLQKNKNYIVLFDGNRKVVTVQ